MPRTPPKLLNFEKVIFVATDGSGDFTSIATAISAAVAGETILVMPGSYDESLTWKDGVSVVGIGVPGSVTVTQTRTTTGQILTTGAGTMDFKNVGFTMTWNGSTGNADCITASGAGTVNLRGCRIETFEGTATGGSMRAIRQTAGTVNILEHSEVILSDDSALTSSPRPVEFIGSGTLRVDSSIIEAGTNAPTAVFVNGASANIALHASTFKGTVTSIAVAALELSGNNRFESGFDGGAASEAKGPDVKIFAFNLPLPGVGEDFTLARLPAGPKEFIRIIATIRGGTSVTGLIKYHSDRTASGFNLINSTPMSNKTTGQVISVANESVSDDQILWLETTAVSGSVEELAITMNYIQRAV